MIILQISDLHFGGDINPNYARIYTKTSEIIDLIGDNIRKKISNKEILIIALCGDILFKGGSSSYLEATEFFEAMKERFYDFNLEFLICPGNHDLHHNRFDGINKISFFLRSDTKCHFNNENTVRHIKIDNINFILVNSIYHKDINYGMVDLPRFKAVLKNLSIDQEELRIAISHHHLIPIFAEKNSAMRNAYDFLSLCLSEKVNYILHGHVHSAVLLGTHHKKKDIPCTIVGVGSLLGRTTGNYNNQFNVIDVHNNFEVKNFKIMFDSIKLNRINVVQEIL